MFYFVPSVPSAEVEVVLLKFKILSLIVEFKTGSMVKGQGKMVLLKSSKKKEREETRKFIEHFPSASTSHPLFY